MSFSPLSVLSKRTLPKSEIAQSFELRLMICQVFNLACLFEQLSIWLIAYALVSLIGQFSIALKLLKQPATMLKLTFALSGAIILALSSLSMGLLLSMVHLLCLAYILKPLELNKRKDVQQIKLLNLFVLAAAMIFQQSLYFAIVIFFLLIMNIALFVEQPSEHRKLHAYKLTGILLCQSLPMAILLFITFPKLGPFWQMPHASSTQVGLSDNVKIGDIANLALSNELAFRVEFESYQPKTSAMYWRAIVLEDFDGISWQRNERVSQREYAPSNYDGAFRYTVFVEPNHQSWLFGLDVAWLVEGGKGKNLSDYTMLSKSKIRNTMTYQVTSTPNELLDLELNPRKRRNNLDIPAFSNPRLTDKGRDLRAKYKDDGALVQAALQIFNTESYRYTLKPPLIANNSLDQFYFDTKAGFCEHYASSFAYLMRAAGIPARVVAGYLGGELNRAGGYYNVYQRDAHAWTEVWLPNQGWRRIDPTAAVDISRIEQGLYGSLLDEQRELTGNLGWVNDLLSAGWVVNMSAMVDAIDYQWTKWVIGYNAASQLQLLTDWFGEYSAVKAAVTMFLIIVGSLLYFWLINIFKQYKRQASLQVRYMVKLKRYLARYGCAIEPYDTGEKIVEKASLLNEELRRPVKNFVKTFQKLEYAANSDEIRAHDIRVLKSQWKEIRRVNRY